MLRSSRLPILILAFYAATPALADDSCTGFTWNVQHERALFATKPTTLDMGRDLASAPVVTPDHLYELTLIGQDQITYAIAPAKNPAPGASGGLLRIAIAESGTYRISIDQALWIDVAANGALLTSKDYQGRPGCTTPHKIVEFALTAGAQLTLQLSGAVGSKALITLTLVPPASRP